MSITIQVAIVDTLECYECHRLDAHTFRIGTDGRHRSVRYSVHTLQYQSSKLSHHSLHTSLYQSDRPIRHSCNIPKMLQTEHVFALRTSI